YAFVRHPHGRKTQNTLTLSHTHTLSRKRTDTESHYVHVHYVQSLCLCPKHTHTHTHTHSERASEGGCSSLPSLRGYPLSCMNNSGLTPDKSPSKTSTTPPPLLLSISGVRPVRQALEGRRGISVTKQKS